MMSMPSNNMTGGFMSFAILTDTACNLPESLIDEHDLAVMALEFNVEGTSYRSYLKGEVTNFKPFYEMMRAGKVIRTSLARISEAEELLRALFDAEKDVLYLGFDSALSGTYELISAHLKGIAANEYPQRKLVCVDTLAAALGQGLFVLEAVRLRSEGKSLEEVGDWALRRRLNFAHWFTVDDLNFLQRGGRLSKGVAIAGTLLNIKPILHVDDQGRLVPVDKVRGRKKSLLALVERFASSASEPKGSQRVCISHGDCIEDALFVADALKERFGIEDPVINFLDVVIAAHSGPGTVALFFTTESQR
jgi:DegV family protein with EDD domain